MNERYRLMLAPSAARALENRLKPSAAFALFEFMNTVICDAPRRLGKPLTEPFDGFFSARRGAYRVIYQVDEQARTVEVTYLGHRADIYRSR
ncbi:MAG: type II toxin-antitoxin system RelE/ParE family toxin [Micrococcales bacterium]|nr:type II toxin-antitoxin system RelE/ParE family toxin [Micrococcales bacterium]